MTMNTQVIAESTLAICARPVRLTKSISSGYYTVDGGSFGFLRTLDEKEAKDYYCNVVMKQLIHLG